MLSRKSAVLAFAAAAMLVAPMAFAAPGNWNFGLAGGAYVPMGDFGKVTSTGFSGGVWADYSITTPFAIGPDITYNRDGAKGLPSGDSGNMSIMNYGVHGRWMFPTQDSPLNPYVNFGVGMYSLRAEVSSGGVSVSASDNKFGINGGAGLNVWSTPSMTLGLAGSYHDVFTEGASTSYFNVGLNVSFTTIGTMSQTK